MRLASAHGPHPARYDEPIEHIDWGVVVLATGETARMLTEKLARMSTEGRDDLALIKRRVVCDP